MRMSRFDWLAGFFRPETPRQRRKPEPREKKKKPPTWIVLGKRFVAFTKSEARAQAKEALKLRRKDRLPVGTVVVKQ